MMTFVDLVFWQSHRWKVRHQVPQELLLNWLHEKGREGEKKVEKTSKGDRKLQYLIPRKGVYFPSSHVMDYMLIYGIVVRWATYMYITYMALEWQTECRDEFLRFATMIPKVIHGFINIMSYLLKITDSY